MTEIAPVHGQTWFERDLPVLMAVVALQEESNGQALLPCEIADRTGLDESHVMKAIRNLEKKFLLTYKRRRADGSVEFVLVQDVTADGLIAAGMWPSGEAIVERLIAALEAAIDEEPKDSPKSNKLKAVLSSIQDLGVSITGSIIAQGVMRTAGMG
ncbi:MAG: hypothetical protein FWD18_09680 [Micrococcales bacterium]|nr:hypothetical protein [Micrococcales bacterium]